MSLVRRIARPMLASVFIVGGLDQIRRPGGRSRAAAGVTHRVSSLTGLPDNPDLVVRINGAIMATAGLIAQIRLSHTPGAREGKPGLAYRARLARQQAQRSVRSGRRTVRLLARSAKQDAKITALQAQHALA